MKSDIKLFEEGGRRLKYNAQTKIAKVWSEDMASAKEFLMKHMDERKIGVVKGVAVTLSYAPEVTFIIRGKQLYSFASSKMDERASYRRSTAFAGHDDPKAMRKVPSFSSMVEQQEKKKPEEEWVELVIYCPSTQRFLFEITRGKVGFPIALVHKDTADTAVTRLSDIASSVVTHKHVKKFNEVTADGVRHHFFFMVCKHEFIPKHTPKVQMKWVPHKAENKNFITELMFEKDPTIKQIVENEKAPQKMDFSRLVEDILD